MENHSRTSNSAAALPLGALPRRVVVKEVVSGRYAPGTRPLSWDERTEKIETVLTTNGETLKIFSDGGQSTPGPGWELMLTKNTVFENQDATAWTLYGITSPQALT